MVSILWYSYVSTWEFFYIRLCNTLFFKFGNPYNCRLLIWNNFKLTSSSGTIINQTFSFTIFKIIFPLLSALKLFVFVLLPFSINSILNIMSSENFNYSFHLLHHSLILHLNGVLPRRICFTLFVRFFYISNDG